MWEPRQPVDGRRPDRFRPPHCPWPECPDHQTKRAYRFIKKGRRKRTKSSRRRLRRFQCSTCKREFSQSAFSLTYYLKRPELLRPVASLLISGCGHRQIARDQLCAASTVTRLSVRIGRHAEQFLELWSRRAAPIDEPVVLDHFEGFIRSQQERLGVATAVGQYSWFVYALRGAAYLRLKGRSQRKRALKVAPRQTPRGTVLRSTLETLEILCARSRGDLSLVSDDHPAYRVAVRRISRDPKSTSRIRHSIHRNPDRSPGHDRAVARARDRALFAVDLLHKLLRHSQAHHRRETIAFGRKRASVMGRAAIFAVWRNMIKLVTERRPTNETPATRLGLTSRPWTWTDVLAERIFPARLPEIAS